jgi:hypothetical protein
MSKKLNAADHPFAPNDRARHPKHGDGLVISSITLARYKDPKKGFLINVEIAKGKTKTRVLNDQPAHEWNRVFEFPTADGAEAAATLSTLGDQIQKITPDLAAEVASKSQAISLDMALKAGSSLEQMTASLTSDLHVAMSESETKKPKRKNKESFPTKTGQQKTDLPRATREAQFQNVGLLEGFEFGDRQFVKVGNSTALAVPILSADHEPFVCLATPTTPLNSNSKVRFRKRDIVVRISVESSAGPIVE